MADKNKMSLSLGIAFVAFSTQFGGGFASGNQIMQFFVDYGVWSIILPVFVQGLLAFFFCYGSKYAYANKTYDYRSFTNSFYGKFNFIFSNLIEVVYLILIATVASAAFATGGATLEHISHIPYGISTVLFALLTLIIVMYGTNIVRMCASTVSVFILIGLVVVLIPNIAARWHIIVANIISMAGGKMPLSSIRTGALAPALGSALVYFFFQLGLVGLMYQQLRDCTSEKQINKATMYMFILNSVATILVVLGMCSIVYSRELIDSETSKLIDIPMILLVEKGVGASLLTPVIYVLIILGSLSTGFNMIAGIVSKYVNQVCKNEVINSPKRKKWRVIFAVIFTFFTLVVAQKGIGDIISTGYRWLGFSSCVVVGIPYVVHIITNIQRKSFKPF